MYMRYVINYIKGVCNKISIRYYIHATKKFLLVVGIMDVKCRWL